MCLWVAVSAGGYVDRLCDYVNGSGVPSVPYPLQGLHKMLEDTNLDPKEIGRAKAGQVSGKV